MSSSKAVISSEITATGGESGAIGYEYQINVTVWIALELMVERGWCNSIEVEPASDEDVAAQLDVPTDDATANLGISAGIIDLDIQIKSRSTGQWTAATFRDVVNRTETQPASSSASKDKNLKDKLVKTPKKKGPPPRSSPLERLTQDSTKQYLFVTNADVDTKLKPFVVSEIGARSMATKKPWAAKPEIDKKIAERIAILPQAHTAFLNLSIDKLLGRVGVSSHLRDGCRKNLVEEIRARLLGKTVKTFSKEALLHIIRNYGGMPPAESKVVNPNNFDQMQKRLERARVLLLSGPPGTGKTVVANELARLFRQGDGAHEIIRDLNNPGELRQKLEQEGRQLFILEDPWGAYKVGDQADLWRKELPSIFAELDERPGKRIIVTSRTGVLKGAGDLACELQRARVCLRSEDYSKPQRRMILLESLKGSEPWHRAWLSTYEDRILDALPEPMALNQLGRRVARAKTKKDLDIEKLIKECAQEALGSQFAEEIKGRGGDAIEAAIVLWAWHGMQGGLRQETISDLLATLGRGGLSDPPDVRKLLKWAEESGWWPQLEGSWRVHPTLLEGIDNLAGSEPGSSSRLLGSLVRGLHSHGQTAKALRLRQQVRARLFDLDEDVELALAHHALERFAHGNEGEASRWYYDAQRHLDVAHPVAKVLKLLKPQGRFPMVQSWNPSVQDQDMIAELSDSRDARAAALRYIKFVIGRGIAHSHNGADLIEFLKSFGWDFSGDCLALALEDFGIATSDSCTTLVEAGLSTDNPDYEAVFSAALDALGEMKEEDNSQPDSARQAEQLEISPANLEHWYEGRSDDYHRLSEPLKAAMRLCRQREGWSRLAAYPRAQEFVGLWADMLEPEAPLDEVKKIAEICGEENREIFWIATAKSRRSELVEDLLKDLQVATADKAQKCLEALRQLIAPSDYSSSLFPALKSMSWPRRAHFAISHGYHSWDENEHHWLEDCSTDAELEAIRCCNATKRNKNLPSTVSDRAVECLEELTNSAESEHSWVSLTVLAELKRPNLTGATQLWQSQQGTDRRAALLAAISSRLASVDEWLLAGLADSDARVREISLRHLAAQADETLQQRLLNLKSDLSALVRKALAEVIGEQKWQLGASALLHLLGDKLDFSDYNDPEERNCFEVARAAATSLGKLKPLDQTIIDGVLEFLSKRPGERSYQNDYSVHTLLFHSLAGESDPRILPFLTTALVDQWNVAAWRHSYYPLRSAAAWALSQHLDNRPEESDLVAPSEIAAAANDFNPSLAGAALIVLGMLGERACDELSAFPNATSFTVERSLLVWLSLPQAATTARDTLRGTIGLTHEAAALLPLLESDSPMTEETWAQFLSENRASAEWLKSLENGDDVEPLLFALLRGDISEKVMDELLNTALALPTSQTKCSI